MSTRIKFRTEAGVNVAGPFLGNGTTWQVTDLGNNSFKLVSNVTGTTEVVGGSTRARALKALKQKLSEKGVNFLSEVRAPRNSSKYGEASQV